MNQEREQQDEQSEETAYHSQEDMVDVYEMFRPSLWCLRFVGVWLPGNLQEAPSLGKALRGGPKAVLYFLYCTVVTLLIWVQAVRFIPFAVLHHLSTEHLIMVIVTTWIFFVTVFLYVRLWVIRKPLIEFSKSLNEYHKYYGQGSYVLNMMKSTRVSLILRFCAIVVVVTLQCLFFFVWSSTLSWYAFPIDESWPMSLQIAWKVIISLPWIGGGMTGSTVVTIMAFISTLLSNEFSEFNLAAKKLADDLRKGSARGPGSHSNRPGWSTARRGSRCGGSRLQRVLPVPETPEGGQVDAETNTENDNVADLIDDLRFRFEHLVELMEKGNDVLTYEILDAFLVFIPFLCLLIRGFMEASDNVEYVIFMTLCGIGSLFNVVFCSFIAIKLNVKAHESSQYFLKVRMKHLSEKTIQILNVFVNRLRGPPIGFSILGVITIDAAFILTIFETLIAYAFVVVALDTNPSSCPTVCGTEANTTASPLN